MKDVAVGILIDGSRVLACQRSERARYPLKWEFPGGKLEPGEDPRDTLRRELGEELGIVPTSFEEFHRQEWVYPEGIDNPGRDGAFRVYYYLVPAFEGDPVNHVFRDIRWVSPKELLSMDILEGNRDTIHRLLAIDGSFGHRSGT
jgi:8-oxo-dGTP diphosphatase